MTKEKDFPMCPSTEELAALYDNALPERKSRALREHLARCQRCCEDVRYLGSVRWSRVGLKKTAAAINRYLSRPQGSASVRPAKKSSICGGLRSRRPVRTR